MSFNTKTAGHPSFAAALERLDELARDLRTGDLDERLARLAENIAEAHQLKHVLIDRAVEIREAIAGLRGNARPLHPA